MNHYDNLTYKVRKNGSVVLEGDALTISILLLNASIRESDEERRWASEGATSSAKSARESADFLAKMETEIEMKLN